MKKFQLLTKSLLVAAMLCVGASAWAAEGDVIYSNDFSTNNQNDFATWIGTGKVPTGYTNTQIGRNGAFSIETGALVHTAPNGKASSNVYDGDFGTFTEAITTATKEKNYVLSFDISLAITNHIACNSIFELSGENKKTILCLYADHTRSNSATGATSYGYIVGGNNAFATKDATISTKTNTEGSIGDGTKHVLASNISGTTGSKTYHVILDAQTAGLAKLTIKEGETAIVNEESVSISSENGLKWIYLANYNSWQTPSSQITIDNFSIVEGAQTVDAVANYKVKYVAEIAGVNTEIKTAENRSGLVGNGITLEDADKNDIWYENVKYIYSSDDASSKTIADDNSTEVTVSFVEAPTYTYSVVDNLGNTLANGSAYQGDNVNFYVPYFVFKDGRFYQGAALSSGSLSYAQGTISNISSDTEITVTYTEEEANTNVVFYSEAENLTGITAYEDNYTNIRMSNGKAGYYSESTPFVTLPAGIYTLQASTRMGTTKFYAGAVGEGKEIGEIASTGAVEVSISNAFLLTEDTPIYASTGGTSNYFDYVIIRKTGDCYESMSIVGDFAEGGFDNLTKGIAMTRDADNPYVWTAVVKDYIITSSKYSYNYKAVANQDYSVYELPSGYNTYQNYNFDYDGAREGKYALTFTVNTSTHSVELAIEKQKTATIYFINTGDWAAANIKAYVWNASGNNGWPGETMTATGNQVEGKDVYSWSTYALDLPTQIIISNNGSDTERTGDQPFVNGATYKADGSSTVTKTISDAGYATYCSASALDFTSATGLTAYIAEYSVSEGKVSFTPVDNVSANTGVLLKGEAGEYTISTIASSTTNVDANVLKGVTAATTKDPGIFVLMKGAQGVGFYKTTNAFTVGANSAYIEIPSTARTFFGFDNMTTAIEAVSTMQQNGEVYDLQGRRVVTPQKGLYIINGKKVVIK